MCLILLLIIVINCQQLINVVFNGTQQWTSNDTGSINNTYVINNQAFTYCYVEIMIDQNIREFHLFGNIDSPPKFIYIDYFSDISGYLEESNKRFLKINNTGSSIYLSVSTLYNVFYTITISLSSYDECAMCYYGFCYDNQECQCYDGYIGSYCQILANNLNSLQPFTYNQYEISTFNYYSLTKGSDSITFEFTTNSQEGVEISFEKSKYIYIPDNADTNLTGYLLERYFVDSQNNLSVTCTIDQEDDIQQIIFLSQLETAYETNVLITVSVQPHSKQSEFPYQITIGVTVSVGSLLLIGVILFFIFRRYKMRRIFQAQRSAINTNPIQGYINNNNNPFQEQVQFNDIQPQYKSEIEIYLNQHEIYIVKQIIDDLCTICLEALENTKVYQTQCHHQFHEQCIYSWLKKQQQCPICRFSIDKTN